MDANHTADDIKPSLRIIFVEDEAELRDLLVDIFTRLGHEVRGVPDGNALDATLSGFPADIVVLDLNLPGEDGIAIARRLRRQTPCGIVMSTSRGQLADRVDGFQSGADLYFVKPIVPLELHAALLSLGWRIRQPQPPQQPSWQLDLQASMLRAPCGVGIPLTANECTLLGLLCAVPGATVSSSRLYAALGYPDDEFGQQRLKTLVSRLRTKVQSLAPASHLPVRARHSQGYVFFTSHDN